MFICMCVDCEFDDYFLYDYMLFIVYVDVYIYVYNVKNVFL